MCAQHNVRASAGDSTGQNTDKGHTPNPRTEIKIPDPAGNRTRAGWPGSDPGWRRIAIFSLLHIQTGPGVYSPPAKLAPGIFRGKDGRA